MAINRSERFIYFQNKAKHYNNLKHMRPAVDDAPPCTTIVKSMRPIPYLRQLNIKTQNEHLIERICSISKAKRSQIETEGSYSRCHKIERPFRQSNKYKNETQRAITIDNKDLYQRINHVKPAIGSSREWEKAYSKSICCKKNLSRFLETNRSKAELHISTDRFVPQHLREYGLDQKLDEVVKGKKVTVPLNKLFELPKLSKRERYNFDFGEYSRLKQQNAVKL